MICFFISDGVTLNCTHEFPDGRNIRAALILILCNIPAARKICGHISAVFQLWFLVIGVVQKYFNINEINESYKL